MHAVIVDETAQIDLDLVDKDMALAMVSAASSRCTWTEPGKARSNRSRIYFSRSRINLSTLIALLSRLHGSQLHSKKLIVTDDHQKPISQPCCNSVVRLISFAEMIAANPALITSLGTSAATSLRRDYRAILRAAIDAERSFPAELAALRLQWAELIAEIGALDVSNQLSIFETNRLQTELATASMNVAYLIARREMARRYGSFSGGPRVAFYGLGRLGTGGVDYGSDLDILITYDSLVPSPVKTLTQDETYSRLVELMIAALSSITREGYLYRVDLRLRPHGKNGPLVTSSEGFLDYLREESAPWEWLAYVKAALCRRRSGTRKMIETHARHRIHANALKLDPKELKAVTRHVRDRLEKEKGSRGQEVGNRHQVWPGWNAGCLLCGALFAVA